MGPHRWSIRTDRSGTTGYMAPEQHPARCARGYDYRVDIYAYGLILLDMMLGAPWFQCVGRNQERCAPHDSLIQEAIALVHDQNAWYLLYNILVEKPSERLHWDEIRQSPFFHGMDWNRVAQREYGPGWTPCAAHKSFHNPTSAIYSFRCRYDSEKRDYIQAMIDASAREGEGLGALNLNYETPEALAHDPLHGTTCTRIRLHTGSVRKHDRQIVCPLVARLRDHF
ncbi:hypothetical protein PAXRUDRAFT_560682 [Paxillus rubicundulus Ve08.2h10]|uniref:Protein kinase domain-containing protein n=1 Tax=Paxillus rubicundulus Ve08.2h10 TaxID=930991 RepID=A0A0D0D712_9AGAM|nr:hypothetical protein PAXRUDRAFT_560682 [Paxillus rubicundulus Ve08.2h10]